MMKKSGRFISAAFFIFLLVGTCMAARGGGFYADTQTGIYHAYTHEEAQPADEARKVTFNTPEEAEKAGYKPCEICNPSEKEAKE